MSLSNNVEWNRLSRVTRESIPEKANWAPHPAVWPGTSLGAGISLIPFAASAPPCLASLPQDPKRSHRSCPFGICTQFYLPILQPPSCLWAREEAPAESFLKGTNQKKKNNKPGQITFCCLFWVQGKTKPVVYKGGEEHLAPDRIIFWWQSSNWQLNCCSLANHSFVFVCKSNFSTVAANLHPLCVSQKKSNYSGVLLWRCTTGGSLWFHVAKAGVWVMLWLCQGLEWIVFQSFHW